MRWRLQLPQSDDENDDDDECSRARSSSAGRQGALMRGRLGGPRCHPLVNGSRSSPRLLTELSSHGVSRAGVSGRSPRVVSTTGTPKSRRCAALPSPASAASPSLTSCESPPAARRLPLKRSFRPFPETVSASLLRSTPSCCSSWKPRRGHAAASLALYSARAPYFCIP